MAQRRYILSEDAIPRQWYNVAADLPSLPPPPLHPGTGEPVGPDDLAPLFPMALILQEVSGERWVPIPDPVREVYSMWRPTPLHRALGPGAGARHDLPHLLQVRGRQPGGQPQAEHLGAAGVLQPRGGRRPARDRDRRRPVGLGAGVRLRALRPGVQGLHGARLLRPEALPSLDDPHLGRRGRAEPVAGHERRPRDPRVRPRQHGQPRHRDQRGGRGRGDPRRHALRARAAC